MRIADAHSSLSEASESYQRDFQHLQSSNQTLSRRLSETIMQCETMEKKLSMVMKREKQLEDEKLQLQKEKIAHKKSKKSNTISNLNFFISCGGYKVLLRQTRIHNEARNAGIPSIIHPRDKPT